MLQGQLTHVHANTHKIKNKVNVFDVEMNTDSRHDTTTFKNPTFYLN